MNAVYPLHALTLINPQDSACALEKKAFWWDVASKTALVAIAAIALVAFGFVVAAGGAFPLPLVVCILMTPFCDPIAKTTQKWSQDAACLAKEERSVAEQLKKMQGWDLTTFNRELEQLTLPTLNNPEYLDPYRRLLARFLVAQQKVHTLQKETKEGLALAPKDRQGDSEEVRTLRYLQRVSALDKIEDELLPEALKAAFLFQLLRRDATSVQYTLTANSMTQGTPLGSFHRKGVLARILDQRHGENDDCFRFDAVSSSAPPSALAYQDVLAHAEDPAYLAAKLFSSEEV